MAARRGKNAIKEGSILDFWYKKKDRRLVKSVMMNDYSSMKP
jgi:hypothetical protein